MQHYSMPHPFLLQQHAVYKGQQHWHAVYYMIMAHLDYIMQLGLGPICKATQIHLNWHVSSVLLPSAHLQDSGHESGASGGLDSLVESEKSGFCLQSKQ